MRVVAMVMGMATLSCTKAFLLRSRRAISFQTDLRRCSLIQAAANYGSPGRGEARDGGDNFKPRTSGRSFPSRSASSQQPRRGPFDDDDDDFSFSRPSRSPPPARRGDRGAPRRDFDDDGFGDDDFGGGKEWDRPAPFRPPRAGREGGEGRPYSAGGGRGGKQGGAGRNFDRSRPGSDFSRSSGGGGGGGRDFDRRGGGKDFSRGGGEGGGRDFDRGRGGAGRDFSRGGEGMGRRGPPPFRREGRFVGRSGGGERGGGRGSQQWDNSRDRDTGRRESFVRGDDEELDGEEAWESNPRATLAIDPDMDYLYGVSPVLNALAGQRRELKELYVQEGMKLKEKKDQEGVAKILQLAEAMNVTQFVTDKHQLNLFSDNRPHQGFVLKASPVEMEELKTLPDPEGPGDHWLALDEVWDPQNLGALLRSAYFLGIKGVVVCAKNSAPLSPTVSKASSGALELVTIHNVKNMMRLLESCREQGYTVMGTSLEDGCVPLREVKVTGPTVLVLGNEGHGLRTNVKRACDVMVQIEGYSRGGPGVDGGVDSLNVSVTGGILMHFLQQQQHAGPGSKE